MTAAQHSSAAAVLRAAKSDETKALLCEHSATLTLPEECRAGNMAAILTLLDGGADVDAKSDGEGAEPLFTPGTGRLKRAREQMRGARRRYKG